MNVSSFARTAVVAALAGLMSLGQVPAASADPPPAPVVPAAVVIGDPADALPSLSNVAVTPTATGFDVSFDYEHFIEEAHPAWGEVRLGIYTGDPALYPFSSETVRQHGYGDGPDGSLVPTSEVRAGRYVGSFEHERAEPVTVMLFTSENCDCPGGTVFAAGASLEAIPFVTDVPSMTGTFVVGTHVAVDAGTWSEGTTFAYQWFAGDSPVADAVDDTLTLTPDLVSSALRVAVTGSLGSRAPVTVSSPSSPLVVQPGTVALAGSPKAGATLTAETSGWASDSTFAYQWSTDAGDLAGRDQQGLELTDDLIGAVVHVTVTATHPQYATASARSDSVRVAPRDLASALPAVSGTLSVGSTLTAVPGTWTEGTTFSYQWLVGGAAVPGATTETYALTSADAAKTVSVRVTGSLANHTTVSRTSPESLRVVAPGTPSLTGALTTGATLTAKAGTWAAGTTIAYQWLADGTPVAGQTGSTIVLAAAQSGAAMSVRVTATRPGYATITRTSAPTVRVMRWTRPSPTGTLAVGSTLGVAPGAWTAGTSFRYQWLADGKAITGATRSSFTLTKSQAGRGMSVRITGTKAGHASATSTSTATARVMTAGTPAVSGTPVYGSTLTTRTGTWTASTRLAYAWLADGVVLKGATTSTLKLGASTRGKRIAVRVTGSRSGYATVSRTSSATARVATVATPTVAGTRLVTYTLSARVGSWTSGTTFRYQWYANGKALTGATRASLGLGTKHVGKRISVRVTGSKAGYPTVARTSAATGLIGYPNRTQPSSEWNCPSWAPIKGNADSMIYHVPSGAFYDRTKPEECFRTESAAVKAGYRKSKR